MGGFKSGVKQVERDWEKEKRQKKGGLLFFFCVRRAWVYVTSNGAGQNAHTQKRALFCCLFFLSEKGVRIGRRSGERKGGF